MESIRDEPRVESTERVRSIHTPRDHLIGSLPEILVSEKIYWQ